MMHGPHVETHMHISGDTLKPLLWFAGAIVAACLLISVGALSFSIYGAVVLVVRADAATKAAAHAEMRADLANYSVTELRVEAAKAGFAISVPKKEKHK